MLSFRIKKQQGHSRGRQNMACQLDLTNQRIFSGLWHFLAPLIPGAGCSPGCGVCGSWTPLPGSPNGSSSFWLLLTLSPPLLDLALVPWPVRPTPAAGGTRQIRQGYLWRSIQDSCGLAECMGWGHKWARSGIWVGWDQIGVKAESCARSRLQLSLGPQHHTVTALQS